MNISKKISSKDIVALLVPQYLVFTVISTILFSILISEGFMFEHKIVLVIVSLSCSMFGLNISNQVFDFELDKVVKPRRPLPSNKITKKNASVLSIFFYIVAITASFFISSIFTVIILSTVFASFLYSANPFRLKKFLFGSNIFGSFFYAIVPFLSAWSISYNKLPIDYLILFGSLTFFIATFKDFEDADGDKKFNITTFPNFFGNKKAIQIALVGIFATLILFLGYSFLKNDIKSTIASVASVLLIILLKHPLVKLINIEKKTEVFSQGKVVNLAVIILIIFEGFFSLAKVF